MSATPANPLGLGPGDKVNLPELVGHVRSVNGGRASVVVAGGTITVAAKDLTRFVEPLKEGDVLYLPLTVACVEPDSDGDITFTGSDLRYGGEENWYAKPENLHVLLREVPS